MHETWAIAHMFSLLVGDLVPEDNDYSKLFLLLLEITEFIIAPKCTPAIAVYVQLLIWEHHSTFRQLYIPQGVTSTKVSLHGSHATSVLGR